MSNCLTTATQIMPSSHPHAVPARRREMHRNDTAVYMTVKAIE